MYWSLLILISVLFLMFGIITVSFISNSEDSAGPAFIATAVLGLILWGYIEGKTYTEAHTKDIKPKELSILLDKDVAIIRYGSKFQKNYETKKEYDAIKDSSFVLSETTEYNIQGEENGCIYELKIK